VLIEQILNTGYIEWRDVLPCDRAVAMPTATTAPRPPFTEARARDAGWQWRIPLQHRTGNGYVYCSEYLNDEAALDDLLRSAGGKPLIEPRRLRFVAGRRKLFWNRNCVALGLASGFLEPLESTSIHLVMSGVYKLLEHFPNLGFTQSNIDSYNNELIQEMERIRDFIVLHYCLTERTDTPFWQYCRSMALPDTLVNRIELYRRTGRIRVKPGELFTDVSWFYIFDGLGVRPETYDPLLDVVTLPQLRDILSSMAIATDSAARAAPSHDSHFAAGPAAR
jgi:tryptophan halogenase